MKRRARQLTPDPWSRAVRRLARDLAAAHAPPSMTHAECEKALLWYVSAEQRHTKVRALYPAVWQHVQTCARCADTYQFLTESMDLPPSGPALAEQPLTAPLTFLGPRPFQPWFKRQAAQLLGPTPRAAFLFNPAHLQQLFANRPSLHLGPERVLQRSDARGDIRLLLRDELALQDQPLGVEVWLVPVSVPPTRYQLELTIHVPDPLRFDLKARLDGGNQQLVKSVVAGRTIFEDLVAVEPSKQYQDIPSTDFQLTLEAMAAASHRIV